MIEINKPARRILGLMNGNRTLKLIIKAISADFKINEESVRSDVHGLIGRLRKLKAIESVSESRQNRKYGLHKQTLVTANPAVVFQERNGGGAELLLPDSGAHIRINPIGVLIWKHIRPRTIAVSEVASYLKEACKDAPRKHVEADVLEFIADLQRKGMIGADIYE